MSIRTAVFRSPSNLVIYLLFASVFLFGSVTSVNAQTTSVAPPASPTNLRTTGVYQDQVYLVWTASANKSVIKHYQLERCVGVLCTNFTLLGSPLGTSFYNTSVLPGTVYTYRVRAISKSGIASNYSNSISVSTLFQKSTPTPAAPALSLSPSSLSFGGVTMGNTSDTKTMTISNTGNAPLGFTNYFAFTGDFTGGGTCSISIPLQPGASCVLNVTFKPSLAGGRTGTITMATNVPGSPRVVQLSGTGEASANPTPVSAPALSLSPSSLNFGSVTTGNTSDTKTITISNTGSAPLSFTNFFAFTGDFTGGGTCSTATPLPPGSSCVLNVTFKPSLAGGRTGTITMATNVPGSPRVVQLTGTGEGSSSPTPAPVAQTGKKVVGYFTSWGGSETALQYGSLTHIMYSFVLPTPSGGLNPVPNPAKLQNLVTLAHQNGVKVGIAVGGWNDGNDSAFETLAASAAGRTAFVNNMVSFVSQYNLDGVDIDWEYPNPGASGTNFGLLMNQLATELHARGKFVSAAVVALGDTGGGVPNSVFNDVDFLNLMSYDASGANHSPYQFAIDSLNYWVGRGLPREKAILGVPFYARPNEVSYSAKVAANPANRCRDTDGIDYWNGIPTIRQKGQLARSSAGGIMTWELAHDTAGADSLTRAMHESVNGLANSFNCP